MARVKPGDLMSEETLKDSILSFMEAVFDLVGDDLVTLEDRYADYEVSKKSYEDRHTGDVSTVQLLVKDDEEDSEPSVVLNFNINHPARILVRKWVYEEEEWVDQELHLSRHMYMTKKEIFKFIVPRVVNLKVTPEEAYLGG